MTPSDPRDTDPNQQQAEDLNQQEAEALAQGDTTAGAAGLPAEGTADFVDPINTPPPTTEDSPPPQSEPTPDSPPAPAEEPPPPGGVLSTVSEAASEVRQEVHDFLHGPLHLGLDIDEDVRPFLPAIAGHFDFILRYSKNYSLEEHAAVSGAGVHAGLIYEAQANDVLGSFTAGVRSAHHFLQQVDLIGLRPGTRSAVFPACDIDLTSSQLSAGLDYYKGWRSVVVGEGWLLGAYAPGALLELLTLNDTIDYPWSVGAKGWNNTHAYDLTGKWVINQGPPRSILVGGKWAPASLPAIEWPDIGADYDPNVAQTLDWAL